MVSRWPSSARRRRRARNQRAKGQVAAALAATQPVVGGCLYGSYPDYCGEEVVADCSLCHTPLCSDHVVDELEEILCPSCWSGYLQREGSWYYAAEKEVG